MVVETLTSQQRESNKSDLAFLFRFTKKLSAVKCRRQLLNLINRDMGNYLNVEYSTLYLVNTDQQIAFNYFFNETLTDPDDPFCESLTMTEDMGSAAFDLEEISEPALNSLYLKPATGRITGKGYILNIYDREMIMAKWLMIAVADGSINQEQNALMAHIANLLLLVLHRLQSEEMISKKNIESEALQSLNIDLASIRDKEDLLRIIQFKLKSLFEFGYHWLTVLNEDQITMSTFLQDSFAGAEDNSCFEQAAKVRYDINDRIFHQVLSTQDPQIFEIGQVKKLGSLPDYMRILHDSGVNSTVMTSLQVGTKRMGVWTICLKDQQQINSKQLSLIKGLSSTLSIAISNIMANQEIADREQEKSRLLTFSNAIASVLDKGVLAKILKEQLKDLFNIKDYVIHFLSDDKQKLTPVLFDADADFAQCADFQKLIGVQNEVNDGIFNKIIESEDPVFFDIDLCLKEPGRPDYLNSAQAIGLRQMIGAAIRLGQQDIAIITFIHDDHKRIIQHGHLFSCICSQIALTISNMLANERIICQLTEINNYKSLLEEEKIYLKEEIETTLNYSDIVGESAVMQKTFRLVAQVAPSDSTVLILGETGTGKELIARAIHNSSPRKNKLMVKVNCAALPANLIESELFGHERGSFTGATERRLGKFELANHGTLFLDEIGDMPLELQVKLLRALQEKEIERVGGRNTIKVDVRIIAATNRDLEKEMAEGRFRTDLYYRLNIFPITLPSLRERKDDIPSLAMYFIERFAKKAGKEINTLSNKALQELVNYHWPGNIRELEHLIERSILLTNGDTIKQIYLPNQSQLIFKAEPEQEFIIKTIDENERDFILKTLKYCNGKIGGQDGAASLLGLPTSTLNSKMKRLGIKKDHHL
jgi:formate hydrogenlyase transcriptional activator